ncbi:MAG: hypothetical protein J5532_06040 [Lachnospiraceae bacterium]|nr:hypothetical protein [Lachnospiraceae bacterium]
MNIAIFPELPLALPRLIFAYIDPATTSYLIQIGVGIVIALGTAIGIFRSKIKKALKGKKGDEPVTEIEKRDNEGPDCVTAEDLLGEEDDGEKQ